MEAMLTSHEIGILTVIAVSGSVIILALGRHKLLMEPKPPHHEHSVEGGGQNEANSYGRRSCLSSGKKCSRRKKVRFAEDVVEPCGNNNEYRRRHTVGIGRRFKYLGDSKGVYDCKPHTLANYSNIPPNRLVLYNGMLQYRMQRASMYC
eukprot:Gb_04730 [translate_table: standard]